MKRFISVFIACILLFQTQLHSHGFAGETPVSVMSERPESTGGAWRNIASIYEKNNELNRWILTYDLNNDSKKEIYVHIAGESESSCYFKIKTHKNFTEEIICTPTQEFYLPIKNKWVAAYNLRVGDHLLAEDSTYLSIIDIEFFKNPIKIYALEVDDTHCYFVGRHAVLTHNVAIPACYISLSVAFGKGALAGGSSSSYFGPVAITGGVVLGGVIGIGYYAYNHYGKRRFHFDFDADTFGKQFEKRYGNHYGQEYWNDGNSGQTPGTNGNDGQFTPPPDDEDPNKKGKGSTTPPHEPEEDDNDRDDRPDRSLIREIRNLKKQVEKHSDKLKEYIKDPDKYDNKNLLKNAQNPAQREQIINSRIRNLKGEINDFKRDINDAIDELMKRRVQWN